MGCGPSKGNAIAVQSAHTPRAGPPPVTPPLFSAGSRDSKVNPLDFRRPLPAIGGGNECAASQPAVLTARKPTLSTVPESDEALSNRAAKVDMQAMILEAQGQENNSNVKHTQSAVAFTFDFDGPTKARPAGRLPPLIREKTLKRMNTEGDDLKNSLLKKQQEADDRRQNELNSIKTKKKRRKVKIKKMNTINNLDGETEHKMASEKDDNSSSVAFDSHPARTPASQIVPPLDISTSTTDKNGSPVGGEMLAPPNATEPIMTSSTPNRDIEPRKGSAYNDSTYGSGDENAGQTDAQTRAVDPLRRFSKKSHKMTPPDNAFNEDDEDINPIETDTFFDD